MTCLYALPRKFFSSFFMRCVCNLTTNIKRDSEARFTRRGRVMQIVENATTNNGKMTTSSKNWSRVLTAVSWVSPWLSNWRRVSEIGGDPLHSQTEGSGPGCSCRHWGASPGSSSNHPSATAPLARRPHFPGRSKRRDEVTHERGQEHLVNLLGKRKDSGNRSRETNGQPTWFLSLTHRRHT